MEIKNAKFVTSIAQASAYSAFAEDNIPEIVVLGRSNVGKSSFINMLCNQKKLAKTSQTPGRTRLINVFSLNDGKLRLVDLPGYGYAAASKSDISRWSMLIDGYLRTSKNIVLAVLLVDIRREPSELDLTMLNYLYSFNMPFIIVATKSDKLSKSQQNRNLFAISSAFKVGIANITAVSNTEKTGKEVVLKKLGEILGEQEC